MRLIFELSVVIRAVVAFRCFSEYEFAWWDSNGHEHVNPFSMSHFQMKMNSFARERRTNRPPLKESFFLVRLHPTYVNNLLEECPHALISAHLLISLFSSECETIEIVKYHYDEARRILTQSIRVHQEVSILAWPYNELHDLFTRQVTSRMSRIVERACLTFILLGDKIEAVLAFIHRLETQIEQLHRISLLLPGLKAVDSNQLNTFENIFIGRNQAVDEYLRTPEGSYPVVYIDLSGDYAISLVRAYLNYVIHSGLYNLPQHYSFCLHRALPSRYGSLLLKGGYDCNSFAIKSGLLLNNRRAALELLSKNDSFSGRLIENMLSEYHSLSSLPQRIDNPSLPISMRLEDGEEIVRSSWSDVHLSPVLPRKAVD
jgi:hypothetical protein